METIRLFVGFYIEATKRSFSERSIMIYAVIGTIFGMAVPALFQEGAPLHTYGDQILVIIAANPSLLLFIPIGLLMSLFSSAALSLSFATPPRTFFQAALTAAGRLPHLIALKAALLASSTAALSLLSIPGIIAIAFNAPLATSLLLIGFVIFIPIFVILTFTESFAVFHILFSRTGIRSSVRLGYSLVSRNTSGIAVFAALSLFIMVTVSVFLEAVARFADALIPDSHGKAVFLSLLFLSVQAAYSAIRTGAWFGYFAFLGSTPHPEKVASSQEEEKMIQKEVAEIG